VPCCLAAAHVVKRWLAIAPHSFWCLPSSFCRSSELFPWTIGVNLAPWTIVPEQCSDLAQPFAWSAASGRSRANILPTCIDDDGASLPGDALADKDRASLRHGLFRRPWLRRELKHGGNLAFTELR
jgi:hypothetical protein